MPARPRLFACIAPIALTLVLALPMSARAGDARVEPTNAREAIELARNDDSTAVRLALRPGLTPHAMQVDRSDGTDGSDPHLVWIVEWRDESGDAPMATILDPRRPQPTVQGQRLVVMPDQDGILYRDASRTALWLPLLLASLACAVAAPGGRRGRALAGLQLVASIAFIVMLANVISRDWIRGGNIALFGVSMLAIGAIAALLVRAARHSDPSSTTAAATRLPMWLSVGLCVVSLAATSWGVATARETIDVANASSTGATLMWGGVPVYGNVVDIPGVVVHADTYGPVAYMAYVPATQLSDSVVAGVPWTNVVLLVATAFVLLLIGARRSTADGWWAAAAWLSSPAVAIGAVLGNNDVVVALPVALVLLLAARPAWRGAMVAVAAATKFVPVVLIAAVVSLRGEPRRAAVTVVASFTVVGLALAAIALDGGSVLGDFWERVVVTQAERDDITSIWGLAGIGSLRWVAVAAVPVAMVWAAVVVRRVGLAAVAPAIGVLLALVVLALPQYWPSYVTWLLPAMLATIVAAPIDVVSAGRRAGARPSSSDPS